MKNYILKLDKERELRFGFKATRLIRQKFGERSLESLMNIKWDEVPVLVWAGLKWDDKQLTLENVEDLLDAAIPEKYTILEVTNIAFGAYSDHLGLKLKKVDAGEEEEKEQKKKTAMPTKTIPSTKKQKK